VTDDRSTAQIAPAQIAPEQVALEQALHRVDAVEPRIAASARATLERMLRAVATSRVGPLAWRSAALTPARHPVELTVASTRRELRTVATVIAPEDDPAAAARTALAIAAELGAPALPNVLDAAVVEVARGPVRWGAYLGARHGREGSRHKLYVELPRPTPAAAWRVCERLLPGTERVLGGVGRPHMLGLPLDGSNNGIEVYLRARALDPDTLRAVCGRAGLGDRWEFLREALESSRTRPGPALGGSSLGLSVCGGPTTGPIALAVFAFASHLHRTDARTRQVVAATAAAQGWPSAQLYGALSAPLATVGTRPGPGQPPAHGPMSFVLAGAGPIEQHVALAPPPVPMRAPDRERQPTSHDRHEGGACHEADHAAQLALH
jgi:hypothetical protein